MSPSYDNIILNKSKIVTREKTSQKSNKRKLYIKRKSDEIAQSNETDRMNRHHMEEANITSNFQKEIQKNLKIIKKEKEIIKKHGTIDRIRYESPFKSHNE